MIIFLSWRYIFLYIKKTLILGHINNVLQLYLTGKLDYNDKLFQTIYGSDGVIWFKVFLKIMIIVMN